MKFSVLFFTLLLFLVSCQQEAPKQSGVDKTNFDQTIRPQDDFYRYVNGEWLKRFEIPEDRSNYGSFTKLVEESEKHIRAIVEEAAQSKDKIPGSDMQKIGDFYSSYMDTARIAQKGLEPLQPYLQQISAINSRAALTEQFAEARKLGYQTPFTFFVNQDMKKTTEYIPYLNQSGLGLPDRDYYFNKSDRFETIRQKYLAHIEKMLRMAGQPNPKAAARKIMAMETSLAEHHWTRVQNRDRDKTYNKFEIRKLSSLSPQFDWPRYARAAGLEKAPEVVVRQPDFLTGFGKVYSQYSLGDWKTYLTWKLLDATAPLLPKAFVDADFEFYRKTLRGIEKQRPRWKKAVNAANAQIGELIGKVYVERYFKPNAKQRMVELVNNLKSAFKTRLQNLEWMSEATRAEALTKLSKFNTKIGYPDKWRDYSSLEIKPDDLVGNYARAARFRYQRMIKKLGGPIDRSEWFMNPQTVNAYYNPPMNEVVFPAAILQPPFFNLEADDAVNYGAIGAVIGHEISHGFDDQGRKSDGDGILRDWWTEEDAEAFRKRAQVMVDQYNHYNPIDTFHVNGQLTLGENIADLAGLTVAYQAYKMSLQGKEAPVIDGLTGDQRFFMGWAQVWRRKYRDEELRRRILTDPHAPSQYRANGVLANMPEFYAAFDVKPDDAMYIPEDQRVKIW